MSNTATSTVTPVHTFTGRTPGGRVPFEVEPPHRLRFTIGMPQFSPNRDTLALEITPDGAGCVVVFEQAGDDVARELRELAPGERSANEEGWQQGFDLMEAAWT